MSFEVSFERGCGVSFTENSKQRVLDRRCRSGKSTLAVMLESVSWDGESGYITCRAQSARDSVRTEQVREI